MRHRVLALFVAGFIVSAAQPSAATTQPPIPTPTPTADDPGSTATPTPGGSCRQPTVVARAAAAPNPARAGQIVELQGSASSGPHNAYYWQQVSGPLVSIAHQDAARASFEAPPVASAASLVFELTVYALGTSSSYQATVEITVLPPTGVAWIAVTDTAATPFQPTAVGVRLYTDLNVARLEHDLDLADPLAILRTPDGHPDCTIAPELSGAAAQFSLRPQGCTGASCTGVHVALTAAGALPNGTLLYRCMVVPGDTKLASCDFSITCADAVAYDAGNQPLPAHCRSGAVHSQYPEPDVALTVAVDPPHPQLGDTVHVSVDTAVGSGLVGIPSYQLRGAEPLLAGETRQSFSGPRAFAYELQAVQSGSTQLSVSVDFETQGGCPGFSYYYFWGVASEPISLTVGELSVTPSPTPTAPTPVDTEFSGIVYDAAAGLDAPISDAEIHYEYRRIGMPNLSGTVLSDAQGRYRFVLPLAGGVVDVSVEAAGFASFSKHLNTSTDLGLARIGGIVQVEPVTATLCGGTLDVTISNTGPPGEMLVILGISADHNFAEGNFGTGFRWDLSAIDLPIVLACGEQFTFPVSYDGAGQQFASQLDLQVISGARAGSGHASYRGLLDGCDPTPTPTATAAPQRTGDLGTKQVRGRVYDAAHGIDAGIAGADVSYIAPHGVGTVHTDDQGDFSFSLFLHDTDLITVDATATGFHPSEVHFGALELWHQSMLDLGLELADPSAHRIVGHVQRDPYCPAGSNVTVALTPLGSAEPSQSLIVPESDEFTFDDVADGDYSVSAQSDCQPSYAPPVSASVRGADFSLEIVFDQWCPPVVVLVPARGAPGTSVEVHGRCYFIHSGGQADISFDAQPLAQVRAGTSGDYDTQIEIPADASGGPHEVRVASSSSGALIGSASFFVESDVAVPCAGDCNGDGHVTIDELVTGVRLALGSTDAVCRAIDVTGEGQVAISELIAAVASALNGCP